MNLGQCEKRDERHYRCTRSAVYESVVGFLCEECADGVVADQIWMRFSCACGKPERWRARDNVPRTAHVCGACWAYVPDGEKPHYGDLGAVPS